MAGEQGTDDTVAGASGEQQDGAATDQVEASQQQADDEAAFEAGYSGEEPKPAAKADEPQKPDAGDKPAGDGATTESDDTVAGASGDDTQAGAEVDQGGDNKAPVALTPEQITELLTTVNDLKGRESKLFGALGAIRQQIDAMKTQPAVAPSAIKVTKESLKRLSTEFPELAELLAEDLSTVVMGGAQAPDMEAINKIVSEAVTKGLTENSQVYETRLLTLAHPDWRQVAPSPEFAGWAATQSAEVQQMLSDGWDSAAIAEQLTKFKTWKAETQRKRQTNQQRLETNVAPRGNPSPKRVLTDEEAFVEGYNSAG